MFFFFFFYCVKQDKRVKSRFWLFNLIVKKNRKIGLHGGEIV